MTQQLFWFFRKPGCHAHRLLSWQLLVGSWHGFTTYCALPTAHCKLINQGINTLFITCITPLLWFTSAIVIHDLPPLSSTRYNFLSCCITVSLLPCTVVSSVLPFPSFTFTIRSEELIL